MKPAWCFFACAAASWCAAALWPAAAWSDDLERALARAKPVVVLVATPDRPLSAATRAAVDDAWDELRPSALRVLLERAPARIGGASALSLCVFASDGELAARRDGALDAVTAREWLSDALAAADAARNAAHDPDARFEAARRALALGLVARAKAAFEQLAAEPDRAWSLAARERLARIAVDAGEVAHARELLPPASETDAVPAVAARALFTRGSIELAERRVRAACLSLRSAAVLLDAQDASEAALARIEAARALAAMGESTSAVAQLEALAQDGPTHSARTTARQLAAQLRSPSTTH